LRLARRTERHHLVGIEIGERRLAEEVGHRLAHHAASRVEPPTSTTPRISATSTPASRSACAAGL
jgi:low affinity Fe/Cu permease